MRQVVRSTTSPIHVTNSMVQSSAAALCSCKHGLQTARHMFKDCRKLRWERAALYSVVGHDNLELLLTRDADVATKWAIKYFGIDDFHEAKLQLELVEPDLFDVVPEPRYRNSRGRAQLRGRW